MCHCDSRQSELRFRGGLVRGRHRPPKDRCGSASSWSQHSKAWLKGRDALAIGHVHRAPSRRSVTMRNARVGTHSEGPATLHSAPCPLATQQATPPRKAGTCFSMPRALHDGELCVEKGVDRISPPVPNDRKPEQVPLGVTVVTRARVHERRAAGPWSYQLLQLLAHECTG